MKGNTNDFVSGFREGKAANETHESPDLVCLSKAKMKSASFHRSDRLFMLIERSDILMI